MFDYIAIGFGCTIGVFAALSIIWIIGTICSPSFRNGFKESFRKAQEKRQERAYTKERGH